MAIIGINPLPAAGGDGGITDGPQDFLGEKTFKDAATFESGAGFAGQVAFNDGVAFNGTVTGIPVGTGQLFVSTGTNYTILDNDNVGTVLATPSTSDLTITLPNAVNNENRIIIIKSSSNLLNKVIISGLITDNQIFGNGWMQVQSDGSTLNTISRDDKWPVYEGYDPYHASGDVPVTTNDGSIVVDRAWFLPEVDAQGNWYLSGFIFLSDDSGNSGTSTEVYIGNLSEMEFENFKHQVCVVNGNSLAAINRVGQILAGTRTIRIWRELNEYITIINFSKIRLEGRPIWATKRTN